MEATKRSYLKPEVERFEMKMEAEFLAGSREDVEVIIPPTPEGPTEVELEALKPIIPQDATKYQKPLFASISTLFVILENTTKCQNVTTKSCTNSCT